MTRAATTVTSRPAPSPSMAFRLSFRPKTFSPIIRSSAEPLADELELPDASELRSGRMVSVIRSAPIRNRVAHCTQRPLRPACSDRNRNSFRHRGQFNTPAVFARETRPVLISSPDYAGIRSDCRGRLRFRLVASACDFTLESAGTCFRGCVTGGIFDDDPLAAVVRPAMAATANSSHV